MCVDFCLVLNVNPIRSGGFETANNPLGEGRKEGRWGGAQETIEALGGMDIMPKHSDICRCRHVCIFKLSFR